MHYSISEHFCTIVYFLKMLYTLRSIGNNSGYWAPNKKYALHPYYGFGFGIKVYAANPDT